MKLRSRQANGCSLLGISHAFRVSSSSDWMLTRPPCDACQLNSVVNIHYIFHTRLPSNNYQFNIIINISFIFLTRLSIDIDLYTIELEFSYNFSTWISLPQTGLWVLVPLHGRRSNWTQSRHGPSVPRGREPGEKRDRCRNKDDMTVIKYL